MIALQAAPVADFSQDTWWIWLIKGVFILLFLIISVILMLWVERRGLGRIQTRPGPNKGCSISSMRRSRLRCTWRRCSIWVLLAPARLSSSG